ncbi:MAG: alpha/beta fold hydrolase [Thiohalocapsa sp.]
MSVHLASVEEGSGPPLAILHGLFGSGRNWATIAARLATHRRVIRLDLRNHGGSEWADGMDYEALAADVHAALAALGIARFALLGHSMGGKAAMVEALVNPDAVERLVVVDIAPVAYAPRHLGHVEAMRDVDLATVRRRSDADRQLAAAIPDPAERAFLLQNLVFDTGVAEGRPRWRANLAAIAQAMPALTGFPSFPASARYDGPALFVAGGRSDYLRSEHESEIRRRFPAARIAHIAEAGHWLHAEQPQQFLDLVTRFLAGER